MCKEKQGKFLKHNSLRKKLILVKNMVEEAQGQTLAFT